jgi:hypothetical protein
MAKIVHFSMAGICHGQNHQFQHVSQRLEYVMVKIVSFNTAGIFYSQNGRFKHG